MQTAEELEADHDTGGGAAEAGPEEPEQADPVPTASPSSHAANKASGPIGGTSKRAAKGAKAGTSSGGVAAGGAGGGGGAAAAGGAGKRPAKAPKAGAGSGGGGGGGKVKVKKETGPSHGDAGTPADSAWASS